MFGFPKLDGPVTGGYGKHEIPEDLVVQVLAHEKGGVLKAREQRLFGRLGKEHGEGKTEDHQNNEACPGEELQQPELLAFRLRIFLKIRDHV